MLGIFFKCSAEMNNVFGRVISRLVVAEGRISKFEHSQSKLPKAEMLREK